MTRRLHLLGRGNANEGEHQGERHADGIASGQTGTRKLGVDVLTNLDLLEIRNYAGLLR